MKNFKFKIKIFIALAAAFCAAAYSYSAYADSLQEQSPDFFNLKSIGSMIAEASNVDVRIVITKESKADAFIYPDGTIVLTEGIINLAGNDSEIAFVIAHEVGHITMGHYRQEIVYSILDDLSLSERAKEEVEADLHGAVFMQTAGYDPASAVSLLIKMIETRSDVSAYFSERIDTLNRFISQYDSMNGK